MAVIEKRRSGSQNILQGIGNRASLYAGRIELGEASYLAKCCNRANFSEGS
jgi:hypothetical protein